MPDSKKRHHGSISGHSRAREDPANQRAQIRLTKVGQQKRDRLVIDETVPRYAAAGLASGGREP